MKRDRPTLQRNDFGQFCATGYGVAQYFIYAINDVVSIGVRGEIR